jgi:hypothetical protein
VLWFYTREGQRIGPVPDDEFAKLVTGGVVLPETLVWREGMAQWLPHRLVTGSSSRAELPTGHPLCANCARPFPPSELLRFENSFICADCKPIYFQRVFEGLGANPIAAWRSGKFIVTSKGARLPDRCLRCNGATNGRTILKRFQWQPPWVYAPFALIPVAFIAFGVLALFSRKTFTLPIKQFGGVGIVIFIVVSAILSTFTHHRADVYMPLCPRHFRDYYIKAAVIVCAWIVGGAAFIVGLSFLSTARVAIWFLMAIIIVGAAVGMFSARRLRLLSVKRMTKEYVWLRGASQEYLAELPEWDGRA